MRLQVVAVMLLLGPLSVAQDVSHKEAETTIRTAYAKLSYADEVRIVLDAIQNTGRNNLWKANANLVDAALNSRLDFELSEFRFGKIKDIADRKISDFDGIQTQAGGDVLDVTPSVYNYSANGSPVRYVAYIKFSWKPSPDQVLAPAEDWAISKALRDESFDGKSYTDYVTYTVTVTFQQRIRTYKNLVLYGRDENRKLQVHFMDRVADPTAVMFALEHSLYPAAFVETDLRTVPFIDKWLYDNARSCDKKSEIDNNRQDVCCDPESGSCGVAKASLLPRTSGNRNSSAKILPASFNIQGLPIHHALLQSTAPSCQAFNVGTVFSHGLADSNEHTSGQHNFTGAVQAACTYTDGIISPGPCNVTCNANSSSTMNEFGGLSGLVFVHATAKADSTGNDFTNGGTSPISCQGLSGGTVKSCTFPCSTNVSINVGGKGNVGATVSFPTSQLWSDQNGGTVTCQPQDSSTLEPPCPTPPPDQEFTNNDTADQNCEPLIVDVTGDGFHLTDAGHGVVFDIRANNHPLKIPWTADARNGFLVLDRNENGIIDNAWELFGNFTPQNPNPRPNGFQALALHDTPQFGGNGDGVIDAHDQVYSKLRVWIDANHDGVSQPDELLTLPELGIFSISLDYKLSGRTDEFGNVFRYRATINQDQSGGSNVGPKIYDVFFVSK